MVIIIAMALAPCRCKKSEIVRACGSDGDEAILEEAGQLAAAFVWTSEGLASALKITARATIHAHTRLALNQNTKREHQKSGGLRYVGHYHVGQFLNAELIL